MSRPVGSTQYYVNDYFFCQPHIINSYWAGFIAADGCLTPDRNNIRLYISQKDQPHLEKLKETIGFDGPIRLSRDCCVLEVYSRYWRESLEKHYCVTPQKTLTLMPPNNLSYDASLSYIAGYIDGDGWRTQSRNTPVIGFQGTEEVVRWITGFLNMHFPAARNNTVPAKRKDSECWQATVYGNRVIEFTRAVLKLDVPVLERKWYE
jgi:hypothetical protein